MNILEFTSLLFAMSLFAGLHDPGTPRLSQLSRECEECSRHGTGTLEMTLLMALFVRGTRPFMNERRQAARITT